MYGPGANSQSWCDIALQGIANHQHLRGMNLLVFAKGEELPLTGVLGLGRSKTGHDGIVQLTPAQFFAQCYRSLFYWNLFYAKELTEEKKRILTDRIRTQAETITKRFAPRALLTVLEGDLKKLIEDNL